jgi:hypothetical protein
MLFGCSHAAGNKAFVYIAGTECITANAKQSQHSVLKDHPDWLQRKVTGEPAVFRLTLRSGSSKAMKMSGSARMQSHGAGCTWSVS